MSLGKDVQALVEVIQNLSSARSLQDVMKLVRSAAREIAQADGATFVLKDDPYCFYADEDAIMPLWKGQRFPLKICISGMSMEQKQAIVIEDIYQDSRVPLDAYKPTFVKSLAMTPIRRNDPIGAIGTYWKEVHRPTAEQLEMLQALADTTSVAMENLHLYQNLEDQIAQLKKANEAKNEFLTTLSHELKTPMNSIVGWSEILQDDEADEEDRLKGAETIHRNAVHQTHIIDDLLDLSQMVSGRLPVDQKPMSLAICVREAIEAVDEDAQSKNIQIFFEDKTFDSHVLGENKRLRQVIYNVLKNAIKFSPPQQPVRVQLDHSGPNIRLQITDQGIGIDESLTPHIFEIFRQGDGSSMRKYGGLGLGLAIAKHLIDAHKGSIQVYSEGLGKGSLVTITLPALKFTKPQPQISP